MAAILQTMYSNSVSFMKIGVFVSNSIEICFQVPNWQWANIDSDYGLEPNRRQAIIRTNYGLIHWRINIDIR